MEIERREPKTELSNNATANGVRITLGSAVGTWGEARDGGLWAAGWEGQY